MKLGNGMFADEKPWKLILAAAFFWIPFLGLGIAIIAGVIPLTSGEGALMLLCGGFAIASIAQLPVVRKKQAPVRGPNNPMWVCFFIALAMWCAAPLVVLAGGHGWSANIGGPGRPGMVWFLAIFTWGTTCLVMYAFIRQRLEIRKHKAR